jgi:hypothetical protein
VSGFIHNRLATRHRIGFLVRSGEESLRIEISDGQFLQILHGLSLALLDAVPAALYVLSFQLTAIFPS